VLVGSKNQLAIEYEIVGPPPSLSTRLCMWANGHIVGDFSNPHLQLLGVVEYWLEVELKNAKRKYHPELVAQPKEEAFGVLHNAIYGGDNETWETVEALSIKYGGCDLKEGLCSFDGWFVFLVSGNSEQRLLWRRDGAGVMEAKFPADTFETIASECLRAIVADHVLHGRKHPS